MCQASSFPFETVGSPALLQQPLLLLSPFAESIRRPTRATATQRNLLVGQLASRTLILYAHPGGETDALAQTLLQQGRTVYVLPHPAHAHLLERGAVLWQGAEK